MARRQPGSVPTLKASILYVIASILAVPPSLAASPQSGGYVLQQSVVDAGGEESISGSYRLHASMAQPATNGTSASPYFVLQSGFWSFIGSGLVPVILSIKRNDADPAAVDLSWSGNDPPFQIFASENCSDVLGGSLVEVNGNTYTDTPPSADLWCYRVYATAPGRRTETTNGPGSRGFHFTRGTHEAH